MQHARDERREDGSLRARWRPLAGSQAVPFYEIQCHQQERRFTGPHVEATGRIMLARSGGYLRRVNGREVFADRTSVLILRPGDEMTAAHPLAEPDVYTVVELPAGQISAWTTDERWLQDRGWDGSADERLEVLHRTTVATCRRPLDRFEAEERILSLVASVIRHARGDDSTDDVDRVVRQRPATLAAHRRLAYRALEVLHQQGYTLGLVELARAVGCSPHHLSRVFRQVTGQSLTSYRRRIRLAAALDAIEAGERSLAAVASACGFADQAHLTREIRRRLGTPPTAIKTALLSGGRTAHNNEPDVPTAQDRPRAKRPAVPIPEAAWRGLAPR